MFQAFYMVYQINIFKNRVTAILHIFMVKGILNIYLKSNMFSNRLINEPLTRTEELGNLNNSNVYC
jgi:hypothetical protein